MSSLTQRIGLAALYGVADIKLGQRTRIIRQLLGIFFLVILVLLFSPGTASTLHFLFPVLAGGVGIILYVLDPTSFVTFSLWLWILSPFVRRVVDYRSFFLDPSPILLAPVFVAFVPTIHSSRYMNRLWTKELLPAFIAFVALSVSLLIGIIIEGNTIDALQCFCLWAAPIIFSCYLATVKIPSRDKYLLIERNIAAAVLILSIYAILQFAVAPPWDCFWLENMMTNRDADSFGRPEPLQIRVWSFLNGPGVFATTVMVGLLVLLAGKHRVRLPACFVGICALTLTLGRGAWVAFVSGLALLFLIDKKSRSDLLLVTFGAMVCFFSALAIPPVKDLLLDRVQTFSSIKEDHSVRVRTESQHRALEYVFSHPLGKGLTTDLSIGGDPLDSAVVHMYMILGWGGGSATLLAYLMVLRRLWLRRHSNVFANASIVGLTALFITGLSGDIGFGIQGVLLWSLAVLVPPSPTNVDTHAQRGALIPGPISSGNLGGATYL